MYLFGANVVELQVKMLPVLLVSHITALVPAAVVSLLIQLPTNGAKRAVGDGTRTLVPVLCGRPEWSAKQTCVASLGLAQT